MARQYVPTVVRLFCLFWLSSAGLINNNLTIDFNDKYIVSISINEKTASTKKKWTDCLGSFAVSINGGGIQMKKNIVY